MASLKRRANLAMMSIKGEIKSPACNADEMGLDDDFFKIQTL